MKINKITIYILMLVLMMFSVNAAVSTSDFELYISLNDSTLSGSTYSDLTTNSHDFTVVGATTGVSGILGESVSADGINDYLYTSSVIPTDMTVSFWFYQTSYDAGFLYSRGFASNDYDYSLYISDTAGGLGTFGSGNTLKVFPTGNYALNTWEFITLTYNSLNDNWDLYINAIYQSSVTNARGTVTADLMLFGSRQTGNTGQSFPTSGKIDEFAIANRIFTLTEIQELHNSGNAYNPFIFVPKTTPTIQTNITDYYNTENISIQLNTTTNTNMTYYLNAGLEVSICNDCNNSVLNLNSLSEGINSILFVSTDENGQVNTTVNWTNDYTVPVITQIGNISTGSFQVNFSNIFNVTDALSGIDTCFINITELENVTTPDNFYINCTDTQLFNSSGLHNAFVIATDNAGNSNNDSLNFTINPIITINFHNLSGNNVTGYTATITHPDGRISTPTPDSNGAILLSPVNNGSLDLGVHNITFSKLGFAIETFQFNVTETSGGTFEVFNVTNSQITLTIFDRETNTVLTGLTTITLIATTGGSSNTTTGYLNISNINFISEQYQIIATHTGYETETIYFTYNNQQILNKEIYLLQSNSTEIGTINIQVETTGAEFVEGAICIASEWDSSISGFRSVAEGLTNINGLTTLNLELNIKSYRFTCSKSGISSSTNSQIIQSSGTTIPVILDVSVGVRPEDTFGGITGSLTNETFNSTHDIITFNWFDEFNLDNTGQLAVYKVVGTRKTLIGTALTSTSNPGQLFILVERNQTFKVEVVGSILDTGTGGIVLDTIIYLPSTDISVSLSNYGFDILIPILFVIIGIGIGLSLKPQNIYISAISVICMVWLSVTIVPGVISSTVALFVTSVSGIIVWGKR